MDRLRNFLKEYGFLLFVGIVFALMHALLNGKYGYHRDELDMLMNSRQLDWGYVAYPPFTPTIVRLGLGIFGSALPGPRLIVALAAGIAVVLVGLMARDMGASQVGQVMAAIAAGIAPVALIAGTMIQYMAFDYFWWVVISFCFIRLLKTEDPRWWLGIGASIGMAMMTKYTAIFFIAGWVAAILLTPNRRYLRSFWLWAGVGLAILIFLPNLVWQIQYDFISLNFLSAIHARDIEWGRTDGFLPEQLLITANPFTIPFWTVGLWLCLFAVGFKRFRAVGIAFLVTFVLLWISRGRSYYVGPAYAMLLAAGAAGWGLWLSSKSVPVRRIVSSVGWLLLAVGFVVGVILSKPIAPINSDLWNTVTEINGEFLEMVGWEDLTAQVADIYTAIPEDQKPLTVILAGNYGEAGAIDLYGPTYQLPLVISGSNSLWGRGYGDFDPQTVIVVGFERDAAFRLFTGCEYAGQVTNRYGVKNEETSFHTGLYVCRQPRKPWNEMWPDMQWFQ